MAVDDEEGFAGAMARVDALPLTSAELRQRAEAYGVERFDAALAGVIAETLEQPRVW